MLSALRRGSIGPHWLMLIGVLVASMAGCRQQSRVVPAITDSKEDVVFPEILPPRPPLPNARPAQYVGSAVCNDCHTQIGTDYHGHPMGQSTAKVGAGSALETPFETPTDGWLDIPGPYKYRVFNEGDNVYHQQSLYAADGSPVYDQVEQVAYAVGSGQSGRAYLVKKGDSLYQSPIGWYAGSDSWDLSPGYDPANHQGFQRRIDNSCLYCHVGRVDMDERHQFRSPPFLEDAIGCERCHGPGGPHVAFHRDPANGRDDLNMDGLKKPSDPIVNPAHLSASAREDVCNQCHLQAGDVITRYGRDFYDFRPGDRLEDVFVILSKGSRRNGAGRSRAVSHVEQMRESACYIQSDQKLGCTTCHDPHKNPLPADRAAHYRDRCLTCHDSEACLISAEERLAAPYDNSCVACHMPKSETSNVPHTAQTEHRIVRSSEQLNERLLVSQPEVFDNAEERLPAWEVDRARGISMMSTAWARNDPKLATAARELLLPASGAGFSTKSAIIKLGQDKTVLAEIAASYWITGPRELALPFWERAVEIDPNDETSLGGLASIAISEQNWEDANARLEKLTDLVPSDPQWIIQRAKVLFELGRLNESRQLVELALKLNPDQPEIRRWLSELPPAQ
jgi:hypothetical protein